MTISAKTQHSLFSAHSGVQITVAGRIQRLTGLFLFVLLTALLGLGASTFLVHTSTAQAASVSFPDQARVGIHNAYDKSRFKYLINALTSGTSQVEIDVWQDFLFSGEYIVADNGTFGDNNNCEKATSYSQLGTLDRNQDFQSCLDDIALWQQHFPNHSPLVIKLELKNGFETSSGFGPAQLDALIKQKLGSALYTPADLMGSTYSTLDAATRAGAWPSASALTGKIIVVAQAGAYELRVKSYTSDQEYCDYLTSLASAGTISNATIFPVLLTASSTDPRPANSRAPWYVVFGQDAANWAVVDTSFYYTNHYLIIMTSSEALAPGISTSAPSATDAANRVARLASHAATIISVDWTSPSYLSLTTTRTHLTYEAESSANTLAGGAIVMSCTGCSGSKDVGYIGNGGTLQFNGVTASAAGTYTLTIWYGNADSANRTGSLSVNGGTASTVTFVPTGSVQTMDVVSVTVTLVAGNNTLLFSNSSAYVADIDGISIQ